jgi:hypothetical protein
VLEIDPIDAEKMVRDCVCSDCWGDLTAKFNHQTRNSEVTCSTKDCPGHGVVSKRFVEKREQASRGEAMEARTALSRAGIVRTNKTAQQLLSELGF